MFGTGKIQVQKISTHGKMCTCADACVFEIIHRSYDLETKLVRRLYVSCGFWYHTWKDVDLTVRLHFCCCFGICHSSAGVAVRQASRLYVTLGFCIHTWKDVDLTVYMHLCLCFWVVS